MTQLKRVLCVICLLAVTFSASRADAWHGPRSFTYRGYGFGTNHHSFRPSIYNPGWNRSSFYGSNFYRSSYYGGIGYGGIGYWPRSSYISYSYAPRFYSSCYWPSAYYSSFYTPAYYPTFYYNTYYTPVVAPVYYSTFSLGFPTCSVTQPSGVSPSLVNPSLVGNVATYTARKPATNAKSTNSQFRLASQPVQQAANQLDFSGRLVAKDQPAAVVAPASISSSNPAFDSAPAELVEIADAILAAGGYRQAAQAYAQLVVKYGNSDRLVTRRFIAQVANGDYEQAAVVVDLAIANGNRLGRGDLPKGDLGLALGDAGSLIGQRVEGLAANALAQSNDAVPMLAVAHWLALGGDDERADLFKARAEQLQMADTGIYVTTR